MTDMDIELDLGLDAELEAEINAVASVEEPQDIFPNKTKQEQTTGLVSDEPYDRFEALPRPSALFLHGVDDLSTQEITDYVNSPSLEKVQWINDSCCNLVFKSEQDAKQVLQTLLNDESTEADHRTLVPAKPYTKDDSLVNLFIRISTDEDIKERGARAKSRYYQIYGVEGQELSQERKTARREHSERMKKNGGDGRDVFSRLGQRRRDRSRSPVRRDRSRSPVRRGDRYNSRYEEREIPERLKNRLGPKTKVEDNTEVKPEIKEEANEDQTE